VPPSTFLAVVSLASGRSALRTGENTSSPKIESDVEFTLLG